MQDNRILIRRSNAKNNEGVVLPINTGIQLHLRADMYDDATGTWQDISGFNRHFSQSTPSARPSKTTGSDRNNMPALVFDGADWLVRANSQTEFGFFHRQNESTLFIVARKGNTSSTFASFLCNNTTSSNETGSRYAQTDAQSNTVIRGVGGTTTWLDSTSRAAVGVMHFAMQSNDTTGGVGAKISINGGQDINIPLQNAYSTASAASHNMFIGGIASSGTTVDAGFGLLPSGSWIAEIIMYNRILNSSEKDSIYRYLRKRYGVMLQWDNPSTGFTITSSNNVLPFTTNDTANHSNSSTNITQRSTIPKSFGEWYCELLRPVATGPGGILVCGIKHLTQDFGLGILLSNGNVTTMDTSVVPQGSQTVGSVGLGDTICIHLNRNTNQVRFRRNNNTWTNWETISGVSSSAVVLGLQTSGGGTQVQTIQIRNVPQYQIPAGASIWE